MDLVYTMCHGVYVGVRVPEQMVTQTSDDVVSLVNCVRIVAIFQLYYIHVYNFFRVNNYIHIPPSSIQPFNH